MDAIYFGIKMWEIVYQVLIRFPKNLNKEMHCGKRVHVSYGYWTFLATVLCL